jgi:UPF0755 protein
MRKWLKRSILWAVGLALAAFGWLAFFAFTTLSLPRQPFDFELAAGSSLKAVSRQLAVAGLLPEPYSFTWLGRLLAKAGRIQAGNYLLEHPVTPLQLLEKMTSGDVSQNAITFIEGWNFRQMREVMDAHSGLRHDTRAISEADILRALNLDYSTAEGLFFPDTYHFNRGDSDLHVLRRALRLQEKHLREAWENRAPDLPYASPYEALIMASIIEKETGLPEERALIAAVFVNRLKIGMRLQTDPTVIYGLRERFDGNLRKEDLLADGPYNSYTRLGLPPTPIAMPGADAMRAALHPADSRVLYFVAKGNGSHHFSNTLEEHNRAVARFQKGGA